MLEIWVLLHSRYGNYRIDDITEAFPVFLISLRVPGIDLQCQKNPDHHQHKFTQGKVEISWDLIFFEKALAKGAKESEQE